MTITVDRKTLRMTGVRMKVDAPAKGEVPAVSTETEGTFTRVNRPVSIDPPADAR